MRDAVVALELADMAAPDPGRMLSEISGRPRPIRSAGAYVATVRRMHGGEAPRKPCDGSATVPDLYPVADGRLIAPLWRAAPVPPREWAPGRRAWDWIAYWEATQARPGVVGSCYNDSPENCARAWARGIAVVDCPRGLAHLLPRRGPGRDRTAAVIRLGRARCGWLPDLRTADLRRLARLGGAFLRWVGYVPTLAGARPAIDWPALAGRQAEWLRVVRFRADLQAARVPARLWRVLTPREVGTIRALVAHGQADRARGVVDARRDAAAWMWMPERRVRYFRHSGAGESVLPAIASIAGPVAPWHRRGHGRENIYAWGGRVGHLQRALVDRLDGIGRPGQVEWRWVEWTPAMGGAS